MKIRFGHLIIAAETVRYRVTPVYNGNDLLAEKIILEAKSLKTNSPIDFSVTILNKQ